MSGNGRPASRVKKVLLSGLLALVVAGGAVALTDVATASLTSRPATVARVVDGPSSGDVTVIGYTYVNHGKSFASINGSPTRLAPGTSITLTVYNSQGDVVATAPGGVRSNQTAYLFDDVDLGPANTDRGTYTLVVTLTPGNQVAGWSEVTAA